MDFRGILSALAEARVDFVVVGGVGAVLQGVPMTTFGLDIVHSRDEASRTRLLGVLEGLEACHREHLPRRPPPSMEDLAGDGHSLLMTSAGPLDVLGRVAGGLEYPDLVERSQSMDLDGISVRVLALDALIQMKELVGREKDLAQLPLLRRALKEQQG